MSETTRDRAATIASAIAVLLVWAVSGRAQDVGTLLGRVVDAGSRRPISDVTIQVGGTRLVAVTDGAGDYRLSGIPAGAHDVSARRIGYARGMATATVIAGGEVRADFALRENTAQLDAVVVTGTGGAAERRTVGNAITQIDVSDITAHATVTNVTEVLQSRSPGVTILPGSGTPGTSADITIRGFASFTANRPVILIDGIRYNSGALGNFTPSGAGLSSFGGQTTSALDLISPEEIESIEIVKGPAASTLYGADAAGGVIQIITKKGRRGQQHSQWTTRVERGWNDWALPRLNNYTTCTAARQAEVDGAGRVWPGCQGVAPGTVLIDNPLRRDKAALRTGDFQHLAMSVRGGGDRFSYYVNGEGEGNQGVFLNSYNNRRSVRTNFSVAPSDRIDFQVNLGFLRNDLRLPLGDEAGNGILLSASRGKPGRVSSSAPGWSTIDPLRANAYNNQTKSDRVTIGSTVSYAPWLWFNNRLTVGMDYTSSLAQILSAPGQVDVPQGLTAQRVPRAYVTSLDYAGTVTHDVSPSLRSTSTFGSQITQNRTETLFASGFGLAAPDVTVIGSAVATSGSNDFTEFNSVGGYLQEQVGWKNRLFVTGALRADNHSSFGENFNLIVYPKAAVSWIASEDPGLRAVLSALRTNDLKLRAAYGVAGRAPAPYSASPTYSVDRVALGGTVAGALRTGAFGNPDLRPEKGSEIELGFDAGLLDNRFGLELTYYDKRMRDLLVPLALPPSVGYAGTRLQNLGRTRNYGLELGGNGTLISRPNFVWDARTTFSWNRNKLVTLDTIRTREFPASQAYGVVQQNRVGYPISGYWAALPKRNPDGTPLMNGARVVTDTATYIGPSLPTREAGVSTSITLYRNLRLGAQLDYKGGHYLFNAKESNRCISNDNCQRLNDPATAAADLAVYRQVPGVYIERADFVKLRDLSISYTLPWRTLGGTGANGPTVMLAGHNLALWSGYSGIDPEVNNYSNRQIVRADVYAAPQTRRLSLSVTLTY
ncbi:MAG: SusC/RagA family TonB-linked outer membrane protein [Gemmatimonadaceae bacterium]